MAIGTVASRGTGFVRTVVLAAALGSGALAETYNIPNTIPNAIYDLLLGGILTSVVVPLLVTAVRDDAHAGELYAQRLLTVVAVVLGVCTVVGVLAAPLIIDVYAQGLTGRAALAVGHVRAVLPAAGLLLRTQRDDRRDSQYPRSVRGTDVGSGPEQPRPHRHRSALHFGHRGRAGREADQPAGHSHQR